MALFRRHLRDPHFGALIRLSLVFLALVIILFLLGLARVAGFTGAFVMPSIIILWSCSIRRSERKDYLYGGKITCMGERLPVWGLGVYYIQSSDKNSASVASFCRDFTVDVITQ